MMPFSNSGIRNGVFVLKKLLDIQFHKPMINAELTEPCDQIRQWGGRWEHGFACEAGITLNCSQCGNIERNYFPRLTSLPVRNHQKFPEGLGEIETIKEMTAIKYFQLTMAYVVQYSQLTLKKNSDSQTAVLVPLIF
jgi:hypothetical protein